MADIELASVNNSGGLTNFQKGGVDVGDKLLSSDEIATIYESRIATLENTGLTVMTGSSITPQTISTSPTLVNSFDSISVDVGIGTTGDEIAQRMTADLNGVFKLRYESFVSYASNVDITWQIYKNGTPFGNSITLSGQGANIFPLVLISAASLIAADYLELYATASTSTDITVVQANGTLEKTHF